MRELQRGKQAKPSLEESKRRGGVRVLPLEEVLGAAAGAEWAR